jgi:nitrogen fixation/metabolism regulation signal transduction histidine kinase
MNSKRYYINIVLRVTLIAASSLILAFVSFKTNYIYSITVLIIVVIIQTWSLIRYIMRRRDDIKRMLEYIKENNPTLYFSSSRDYPFNELGFFLNEVGDIVREVRIEKESQLQYMNYIVQHVGTGLISFDTDGRIDIINQAAKDLLGVTELISINNLETVLTGLPEILKNLKVGEQKVIGFKSGVMLQQLAIRASVFRIGQKEIKLISLQDIKNELDEKEMDAWQKLIRVLTHEIINSVTPITSLTSTISGFFKKDDQIIAARELSDESISEALTGLGYIEDRGRNLIGFVSKFRSLTRLPAPKFEEIRIVKLIEGIKLLKRDELLKNRIELYCIVPDDEMNLYCDQSLIEHVLINLVNNASEAIISKGGSEKRWVEIKASVEAESHPVISVTDTGVGIPDDLLENIFVPFFTTKENGSGIGLSLSRQIMKLHGGTITAYSKPDIKTIFSLIF